MAEFWENCAGLSIGGKYTLHRLLEQKEEKALFLASSGDAERAVVHLARAGGDTGAAQSALWKRIAKLPHPHVVRFLDIGELELDGVPLAWVATEYPEENLGEVLYDRALTAEEARQALLAVTEALAHLHSHGLAHGAFSPWSVVAADNAVKISAAGAREAGPEGAAEDVRALGLAACEMLTRRVPEVVDGAPQFAPEESAAVAPFEAFIRRCLAGDSAARLAAHLRGEEDLSPAPPVETPAAPPRRAWRIPKWGYWAAAFGAVLAVLLLASARGRNAAPLDPAPLPAVAPPPVAAPEPRPSPFGGTAARRLNAAATHWRVIVYTYSSLEHAEQKARAINSRFENFKAEVFAPGGGPPYLVSLGGRMTRAEALELRRAARAKGLPRDTYVQNYRE